MPKIFFLLRWSRNYKVISKGVIFMFPPIKRSKNDGEKFRATGRNCSNETAKL